MAFNIADFSSKINEHGVAKNNLFFATITTPPGIAGVMKGNKIVESGDLKFFCRSVTLPEFDIATTDYQPSGFGSPTRRPQGMNFPILPAVFMVDSNFGVMKFFHRWAQSIVQYDRSQGSNGSVNNTLPFEMGYKSEYATTMTVHVYSYASESIKYKYEFRGLYPTNVGSVSEAWENNAEVMTLPVGFTYDSLTVSGATSPVVLDRESGVNGLLSWFSTINTVAQAIKGIKRPRNIQDAINEITNISTIVNSFK